MSLTLGFEIGMNNINNLSLELYVLVTLRYLLPDYFSSMEKDESPDLQDGEKGVGIEIVSAAEQKEMWERDIFERFRRESDESKKLVYLQQIEGLGHRLSMLPNGNYSNYTFGTVNVEKMNFINAIKKKVKKAPSYKKNFNSLGLAVVLTEIPTREAEDSFVKWTDEAFSDHGEHFDFVYILSHRFCIYYNLKKKCAQKWDIKDVYMQLRMIGKKLATNEISMDVLKKESMRDYIAKSKLLL